MSSYNVKTREVGGDMSSLTESLVFKESQLENLEGMQAALM